MMEEEACLPEPVHQPGIKLRSLPSEQPIQMSDNASGDEQSSNDGFHSQPPIFNQQQKSSSATSLVGNPLPHLHQPAAATKSSSNAPQHLLQTTLTDNFLVYPPSKSSPQGVGDRPRVNQNDLTNMSIEYDDQLNSCSQ